MILFLMIILFRKRLEDSELSLELTFVMTKLCGLYQLLRYKWMIKLYDKIFKLESVHDYMSFKLILFC